MTAAYDLMCSGRSATTVILGITTTLLAISGLVNARATQAEPLALKMSEMLAAPPNGQATSEQTEQEEASLATGSQKRGHTELDARASASLWSSTRLLDDQSSIAYPQLTAKLTHKLESGVSFVVEGYAGHERALSSEHSRGRAVLREAYMSIKQGPVVAKLGSQIVSWGRADVINPTDNVSAQDYTLLVDSDGDQKFGLPSANVSVRIGDFSVQTIWQPSFRKSTIPLPQRDDPLRGTQTG